MLSCAGTGKDVRGRWLRPTRYRTEVPLDQILDLRLVEISDGDNRHQIRPVPVVVEPPQRGVRVGLENRLVTDRQARAVSRTGEQHREPLVLHSVFGALPESPFFDHDRALLLDLGCVERDVVRPLGEDLKSLVDDRGGVGRDRHHVDRLVEAGVGVDVRTVAHSHRLEVARDLVVGEPLRTPERHVLDHVGEAALIGILENRAGVQHQPQLRALLGFVILADVVAHPIRQHADGNGRIERQRRIGRERGRTRLLGRCR